MSKKDASQFLSGLRTTREGVHGQQSRPAGQVVKEQQVCPRSIQRHALDPLASHATSVFCGICSPASSPNAAAWTFRSCCRLAALSPAEQGTKREAEREGAKRIRARE